MKIIKKSNKILQQKALKSNQKYRNKLVESSNIQ